MGGNVNNIHFDGKETNRKIWNIFALYVTCPPTHISSKTVVFSLSLSLSFCGKSKWLPLFMNNIELSGIYHNVQPNIVYNKNQFKFKWLPTFLLTLTCYHFEKQFLCLTFIQTISFTFFSILHPQCELFLWKIIYVSPKKRKRRRIQWNNFFFFIFVYAKFVWILSTHEW